jgi:hypothetical protein
MKPVLVAVLVALCLTCATRVQAAPFVYVTNAGGNDLSQYDVRAGGLLSPLSPPTVAAGDRPGGVAVSPMEGRSMSRT